MSVNKKTGLGKGLTALLQDASTDISGKNHAPVNSIAEINISDIEANPFQPRLEFEETALDELAESIKLHGVIQPITVRKVGYGKFEIISGERRTRASIRAGLKTIPAYIRVANDQGMLEMALIENIHRENLNAIEIALSYKRLLEECKINQEEVGERVGKNRTTVTNYLRLLKLPEEIQIALRDGQISMGHAKPLINLDSKDLQLQILDDIIDRELNVRQVEDMVKQMQAQPKAGKRIVKVVHHPAASNWESTFTGLTESKVKVKLKPNGKGELIIPFKSEKDLERIAELMKK
jgi:ParB family chromosome partitioning protein